MKKIRVGILGGSFNPCHPGHLHISLKAIKQLKLNQVWWVVSPQNPLKSTDIKPSFYKRIEACNAFTKPHRKIKVKDLEYKFFRSAKKFYTYDLLKRLNAKFKDIEFVLLIGADNMEGFHKWKRFKDIPALAEIDAFNRTGYKYKALSSRAARQKLFSRFIDGKTLAISSTELRNKK